MSTIAANANEHAGAQQVAAAAAFNGIDPTLNVTAVTAMMEEYIPSFSSVKEKSIAQQKMMRENNSAKEKQKKKRGGEESDAAAVVVAPPPLSVADRERAMYGAAAESDAPKQVRT